MPISEATNMRAKPRLCQISLYCWLLAGIATLIFAANSSFAQSEEAIKSALIYNFAKFIDWPASAFSSPTAPFNVGFVGCDTLADTFSQNIQGKNANGRDFVVKKFSSAAGVEDCQIVYVANAELVGPVTAALKGKPVLAVGDPENLLDSGGMIRFVKEGAKIAFDLNLTAAGTAGLKVNPKLQKIARAVKGG